MAPSNHEQTAKMRYKSPAKRPRESPISRKDVQEITTAIHQSVTTKQRLLVLRRLLSLLTCDDEAIGNDGEAGPSVIFDLVEAGTVHALCLQLGFVLHRHGSSKEELEQICFALEHFFRRCPHLTRENSLHDMGPDLFQLLKNAFDRGAVHSVVSIWHSWSGSSFGATLLLNCPGVIPAIVEYLQNELRGESSLMEALGLLKNLSFYADDYRQRFVEQPGLLSTLTKVPFFDANDKVQERLSAVFRNLVISPETRLILAQQPDVFSALVRMASYNNRNTLRNILNTLVSLAMDTESSLLMVFHGDGILIETMKRLVAHDSDVVIRKRAARALRLMARETSAPMLVHDFRLMETLSHHALHDCNDEVRAEAAEAFARCAGLITAPMSQHQAVLDALTHLACSPLVLPEVIARAVKEQASHPENREPMAKREHLMAALSKIAISTESPRSAKEDVCLALLDLSREEGTRLFLATSSIFEALVRNSLGRREDHSRLR